MQPSSLIFLVIVAIWVAYLVQHWVHRREHLATARSLDKFSEAMRVLERRSPLAAAMQATTEGSVSTESAGQGAGSGAPARGRREVAVEPVPVVSPLRARVRDRGPLPPAHPVPPIELVPHRTFRQVLLRRVRGVLFLAAAVAVPSTVVLSAMHILKWLSVAIAVGALGLVLVWLRVAAIRDRAARRAHRAAYRRAEGRRTESRESGTRREAVSPREAVRTPAAHRPEAPGGSRGSQAVTHTEGPSEAPAATAPSPEASPGGWQPVPVPPPTYTLKETARRPAPPARPVPSMQTLPSVQTLPSSRPAEAERPVPIEVEDDVIDVMAAPRRRRVVGS